MDDRPLTQGRLKTVRLRGGPSGASLEEISIDGEDIRKNTYSVELTSSVEQAVRVKVGYLLVDADIELEGVVTHVVMLQRREDKLGPDMEVSPYRSFIIEQVGDSLPGALRRLADRLEEDE